ncbi:hypothetical protein RUM44_004996 [Polyplax serrata]|uniref:Uncharacterized protein n=1 Tax=Polyplax serrata TaxID=468196 RepID=A0ABR1AWM7_POLSC
MHKTYCILRKLRSEYLNSVRCYSKRVLPVDPSDYENLPVEDMHMKSYKDTSLYGWGLGEYGAIGHHGEVMKNMSGPDDPRLRLVIRPKRLNFGELNTVTDIAAGYGFSAFSVKKKNQCKVYGTGLNTDSQIGFHYRKKDSYLEIVLVPLPIPLAFKWPEKTKIKNLAAGRAHLVIVTDLEGVFILGNNSYGQCGRTVIENENYSGSRVVHKLLQFKNDPIKSAECGQDHTLLLTESGKVYACGWGADGQTGLGHYSIQSKPARVLGDIENERIVKLSSKCDCVLALNDKGEVFGWGNSEYSQLFEEGDGIQQMNRPIHLKKCTGFGKIVDVAAAGSHCMMLNEAGDVFTWGYGILGQGPNVTHNWRPKIIPPVLFGRNAFQSDTVVRAIYCGLSHSAAVTNYGDVYMWGKNKERCLGLLQKFDQFFPSRVAIGASAKKLALGVDHSLALCHPFGS